LSILEPAPVAVAVSSSRKAGRPKASLAETLSLTFVTLLFWLAAGGMALLVSCRSYEVLEAEEAYQIWLIAGWVLPAALLPAAALWGRRLWRMRKARPAAAGLLSLIFVALVTAAPIASGLELAKAADIRDLVAAEGRVGPYIFVYWPDGTIGIAGGIGPGFAEDLKAALAQHPNFTRIVITSQGGLVSEAMAAARMLEGRHATVVARWQCDSACVIILMAGERRLALKGMIVGFHAVSPLVARDDPVLKRIVDHQRRAMYGFLIGRGVPPSLIEAAERLGPGGLNAVPADTLVDLGVLNGLVDEGLEPLDRRPG
jgi:hypothetical protein